MLVVGAKATAKTNEVTLKQIDRRVVYLEGQSICTDVHVQ